MKVANIQRFCMHDGPGIRTTVFLKGCPLNCVWCHNPETQKAQSEVLFYKNRCIMCGACSVCENNAHLFEESHILKHQLCKGCGKCVGECPVAALEICGTEKTVKELFDIIKKDCAFYGNVGGVTISGGEPLLQPEAVEELLDMCKKEGINTAIETCGYFSQDILNRIVPLTDLFLWDIKDTDPYRHEKYTSVTNEIILKNLFAADKLGAKMRLRCILVNGVNTDREHYKNILNIVKELKCCEGVEYIPYHSFGGSKSLALGEQNSGSNDWIPTAEQISVAKSYLLENGIKVF